MKAKSFNFPLLIPFSFPKTRTRKIGKGIILLAVGWSVLISPIAEAHAGGEDFVLKRQQTITSEMPQLDLTQSLIPLEDSPGMQTTNKGLQVDDELPALDMTQDLLFSAS